MLNVSKTLLLIYFILSMMLMYRQADAGVVEPLHSISQIKTFCEWFNTAARGHLHCRWQQQGETFSLTGILNQPLRLASRGRLISVNTNAHYYIYHADFLNDDNPGYMLVNVDGGWMLTDTIMQVWQKKQGRITTIDLVAKILKRFHINGLAFYFCHADPFIVKGKSTTYLRWSYQCRSGESSCTYKFTPNRVNFIPELSDSSECYH